MSDKKRVLYIENDGNLVDSLREVIEQTGAIELTVACYMDEAKRIIKEKPPFDAYIVDIMLPRTKEDLGILEAKESERMRLLDKLIRVTDYGSEPLDPKVFTLRGEIDRIDEEIERLLQMDGGLELVKAIAEKNSGRDDPDPLEVPVVFFTARAAPELKDKGKRYVRPDMFRWFEKPEDEDVVAKELMRLLSLEV